MKGRGARERAGEKSTAQSSKHIAIDGLFARNFPRILEPLALMRTDMRRNFKQIPSRITLLPSVEDGIYASDLERTYFMGGGDPGEAILIDKADYPAVPHTAQKIDAARIGGLGFSGPAVLWASRMGICMGGNQGQFKNITEEHFRLQGQPSSGASILRKENGIYQLVCTIKA